jgi:hypothetical protein
MLLSEPEFSEFGEFAPRNALAKFHAYEGVFYTPKP